MLKNFIVALAVLFIGDLSYTRLWMSIIVGFGVVVFIYWLAFPAVLPLWPAVLMVLLAGILGILWERHAKRNDSF